MFHGADTDSGPDAAPPDAEGDATSDAELDDLPGELPPRGYYCGPKCRQVSFAEEVGTFDLWENTIAYSGFPSHTIYYLNVDTSEEIAVDSCAPDDVYAVCTDYEICDGFIYTFKWKIEPAFRHIDLWRVNVHTKEKEKIHSIINQNVMTAVRDLGVHGRYAVWYDDRNRSMKKYPYELFLLDIETREEKRITDGNDCQVFDIRIWKNKIVFTARHGDHEIMLYDIEKDEFTNLSNNIYDQYQPAIWEDRVVWIDSRTEQSLRQGSYYLPYNPDVYVQYIGGDLVAVETEGSIQRNPDIFGDLVVWDDERNDYTPHTFDSHPWLRLEIFNYNLSTGECTMLTEHHEGNGGNFPRVWGNRIFYAGAVGDLALFIFMYEF